MITELAADLFRKEGALLVATLTSHIGTQHLQLAEDGVEEALVRALQTWPYRGVPQKPTAWLTQMAKNLALDYLRREQSWNRKQDRIAATPETSPPCPPSENSSPAGSRNCGSEWQNKRSY